MAAVYSAFSPIFLPSSLFTYSVNQLSAPLPDPESTLGIGEALWQPPSSLCPVP